MVSKNINKNSLKIIVTSYDPKVVESYSLMVEANKNLPIKIYNIRDLKEVLNFSTADLALLDEFVLFKGKKTKVLELFKNFEPNFPIILSAAKRIIRKYSKSIYFIEKPLSLSSLADAIKTFSYMKEENFYAEIIKIGGAKYDKNKRILYHNNKNEIYLTSLENKIFTLLVDNIDECISREILLKKVWGYSSDVYSRTIETNMWRLRKKLSRISNFSYLLKKEKEGYSLKKIIN